MLIEIKRSGAKGKRSFNLSGVYNVYPYPLTDGNIGVATVGSSICGAKNEIVDVRWWDKHYNPRQIEGSFPLHHFVFIFNEQFQKHGLFFGERILSPFDR